MRSYLSPHDAVFWNLASFIGKGEIKPLFAGTYPLQDIAEAQQDFQEKKHIGKIVLVPEGGVRIS